jgi:hypothetical protein
LLDMLADEGKHFSVLANTRCYLALCVRMWLPEMSRLMSLLEELDQGKESRPQIICGSR